ncbi:thermonuclease family protein [Candidatus Pacearchaeota archaeon]|nr:thermonuclease family protein [Candidatus Pacearchaeota archaeon]
MKRKYALLISILLTLLIATNLAFFQLAEKQKTIFVTRVIDGDTFEAGEEKFRLININTPEKSENGYKEAKDFLSEIENTSVHVEEISTDKYGRTLVRVYSPDYVNLQLIEKGLATKFLVQESELELFDEAEKNAVESGLGLWQKSNLYGCIETQLSAETEILQIMSKCGKINIKGFIVSDESRKRYKFQDIEIGGVNLHSSEGKDNETDIFWNSKMGIWNNDRDTAHIFDSEGNLVYHRSYGY